MRAAYDKIYQELKAQIEDGTYGYEGFLPSQAVLVERFGCAHNTVRKALALLAAEGYCQPIHGKGVRVIWQPQDLQPAFVSSGIEPFAETARRNAFVGQTQIKVLERVGCDEALHALTGFALGTDLIHIERLRLWEGRALIHDSVFLDARMADGLTREQAEQSVFRFLEEEKGIRAATSKRTISVERTTDEDRMWLDIDGVDYLAVIANQIFDRNGFMFEYVQERHHPDHFLFKTTAHR